MKLPSITSPSLLLFSNSLYKWQRQLSSRTVRQSMDIPFLGMCVIYGCRTRISSTWGKPYLNSSFQFIASFWTAWWVPGHLTTFKRAPWLHAANSHTAAGTSHLLPYQSPCLCRCFSASSKGSRSGPVQLFFMVHSSQIAVFNFYEPVHDHKHTFIGGVGPIFQFVTTFWKLQQQSCFTIWAARTISCLMCGRELSY